MAGTHDRSILRSAFDQGISGALDPLNEEILKRGGHALTTLRSNWLHRTCPVCGHTFRVGDGVEVQAGGRVVHDDPFLSCSQPRGPVADSPVAVADFFEGLLETWPPPKGLPIRRLIDGDLLLAPPRAGFRRRCCIVCSHTFREHDLVVVCPCNPHAPFCQAAVHRDPIHGLHCLDAWDPAANGQLACPVCSRRLTK